MFDVNDLRPQKQIQCLSEMTSITDTIDSTMIPKNQLVTDLKQQTVKEVSINKSSPKILYRWKGKIVKESTYRHRLALREAGKKRKLANIARVKEDPKIPVEGRRIVDLQLLAKHLKCTSCNEILSLINTESETRRGLASILHVRCCHCLLVNIVPTSKTVPDKDSRSKLYTVNSEVVNGATQAGMTCNRLNKLLSCLNIPQVQSKLFQRYKHESVPGAIVEAEKKMENKLVSINTALDTAEIVQNKEAIQEILEELF